MWNIVAFTILILNVEIVWSHKLPTISYITPKLVRAVGGQVDLSCSVKDANDYPVLWLKYDRNETDVLFISTNTQLILRGPRLALRFDDASATYTLSIKDLEEADSGLYKCQVAVTPTVKVSKTVELLVRRPPSTGSHVASVNDSSTHAQEQFIDIGGQLDLACSVDDSEEYPALWIKYDRNGTTPLFISTDTLLIVSDSRFSVRFDAASATYTLSIKDLQETDAGLYLCRVARSSGTEVVKEVDVRVRRPQVTFENSTKSIVAGEGSNTTSKVGFRPVIQKLTEAKLEVVELQKKLIEEEIEQQLLRKSMLTELFGLQKENLLLTKEILKSQLENKSKELNGTILTVPPMLP